MVCLQGPNKLYRENLWNPAHRIDTLSIASQTLDCQQKDGDIEG